MLAIINLLVLVVWLLLELVPAIADAAATREAELRSGDRGGSDVSDEGH